MLIVGQPMHYRGRIAVLALVASVCACGGPTPTMDAGDTPLAVGGQTFSCTPGAMVEVGCATGCGLGSCTGDPRLVVCDGASSAAGCAASGSFVTQDDDSPCGGLCPMATFACPSSGQFTVAHRAFSAGTPYTCALGVNGATVVDAGTGTLDGGAELDGAISDAGAPVDAATLAPDACVAVCEGACVDTTSDPAHCGSCANACTGTMVCAASHCEGRPPRPIAPLSTSTSTTVAPSFRWELRDGMTAARVEVCRDHACASVEQTFDVVGTSGAPPAPLAHGRHYWRLRSLAGATIGAATSPTWEVRVGTTSAPVSTSWGSASDFELDGYDDVVLGNLIGGVPHSLLRGAPGGPAASLSTAPECDFTSGRSFGDVNGDGYPDLLGTTYVCFGSPRGLVGSAPTRSQGIFVGDVNGDGYGDVLSAASPFAPVQLYLGGPAGPSAAADQEIAPADGALGFGQCGSLDCIGPAGDVNGDGFADVLIGNDRGPLGQERVRLYYGSSTGLDETAPTPIDTPTPSGDTGFGVQGAMTAGDYDGDGYVDVAIGSEYSGGSIWLYRGSSAGIVPETALAEYLGTPGVRVDQRFLGRMGHDVDGDGHPDIVTRWIHIRSGAEPADAGAMLYLSHPIAGTPGMPTYSLVPDGVYSTESISSGGEPLGSLLDIDGDDRADLFVRTGDARPDYVFAYYRGTSGGLADPVIISPASLGL